MDEVLNAAQRTALSPQIKPPATLYATREITASGYSTANLLTALGTAAEVNGTTTSSSNVDLVNVASGKGVLLFCAFSGSFSIDVCEVTITIDGTTVLNAVQATATGIRAPVGAITSLDTTNHRASITFESIAFNTSLRIQYRRASGSGVAVFAAAKYRLH